MALLGANGCRRRLGLPAGTEVDPKHLVVELACIKYKALLPVRPAWAKRRSAIGRTSASSSAPGRTDTSWNRRAGALHDGEYLLPTIGRLRPHSAFWPRSAFAIC